MVSSVLSPEKIVGRKNTNKVAAQNFISGGSLLGSSVINSAANKIVGFQRAGVRPSSPAIDSIVSTISTNINNNITNTVNKTLQGFSSDYQRRVKEFNINNITTNITNTVNKTLQSFSTDYQRRVKEFNINKITSNITNTVNKTLQLFSTDYQKRIKQVDDAKPIGILGNFLNVYKTSLSFIQFFGNKKNIDKVRDNLEALKKSFTESFEIAKLIRQIIIKIVKQLSNLPVASPSGGGGLNLDIDIPGGGLKKSAPKGLGRMMKGRGRMLALGAGALGLGALGAGAVNALSDSPQAQAAGTSPEIPGDTVDKFSSIVDKFANAISNLFKSGKQKPKQQSPGSAGGAAKKPEETKPSEPGSSVDYSNLKSGDISTMAGKSAVLYDEYRNLGYTDEGAKRLIAEIGREGGMANKNLFGTHSDPKAKISNTGMFSWNQDRRTALINEAKKAGVWDDTKGQIKETAEGLRFEARFSANEIKQRGAGVPEALTTQGYSGAKISELLRDKYVVYDPKYAGGTDREYGSAATKEWYKRLSPGIEKTYKASPGAQVTPAPKKAETQQQIAQQVSQPAAAPQSVVMPIDMSGGGQQRTGGGTNSPPPSQGSGPSVPFLPAANPDNFLVLYSRMVYNIVDG